MEGNWDKGHSGGRDLTEILILMLQLANKKNAEIRNSKITMKDIKMCLVLFVLVWFVRSHAAFSDG